MKNQLLREGDYQMCPWINSCLTRVLKILQCPFLGAKEDIVLPALTSGGVTIDAEPSIDWGESSPSPYKPSST